ncbi:MAG: hypothetical protein AAFP17_14845 [Pseudomonadota bacterium]
MTMKTGFTLDELMTLCLELIRRNAQDFPATLSRHTPLDEITMDSLDLHNLMFDLHDEAKIMVVPGFEEGAETVGDLVCALSRFLPAESEAVA